jgi:hypothetical protein
MWHAIACKNKADTTALSGKAVELDDCDARFSDEDSETECAQGAEPSTSSATSRKGKGKAKKNAHTLAGSSSKTPKSRKHRKENTQSSGGDQTICAASTSASAATAAQTTQPTDEVAGTPAGPPTPPTSTLTSSAVAPPPTSPQNTTRTWPPAVVTSIDDLPSTIRALEDALPQLRAPSIDTVESDVEDDIAKMALADRPDMVRYLEKSLEVLKMHRNASAMDAGVLGSVELESRERALQWYLTHYKLFDSAARTSSSEMETQDEVIPPPLDDMMEAEPTFCAPSCITEHPDTDITSLH